MVDVDHPALEPSTQIRGEDLHVPGEDDELDVKVINECAQSSLGSIFGLRRDRNVVEVVAVEFGQ